MNFIWKKAIFLHNISFMERNGESMKKIISKLTLIFFCMSFFMIIPKNVNAAEIIPVNILVEYGQTEARTILNMINEMRTNSSDAWYWNSDDTTKTTCDNLSELAYDYDLEKLAMKRAAEIALSYAHTRPNGERCFSIYDEEGVSYSFVGENIAAGYPSASEVNMGWREDNESYAGQGHRRNMLNSNYNCVGIGHVYYNGCHYWVEEFAYRTSINTTKTTANDSEQTTTLSVDKSNITDFRVLYDSNSYNLRKGETVTPNSMAVIYVSNQWPRGNGIVADAPTFSMADSSIATYSNGKILGVSEGTTTLTASLYGLTATIVPTINVHDCNKHWDQGKITKQPTTKHEGEKTFTCSVCGKTYSVAIAKISSSTTNPTNKTNTSNSVQKTQVGKKITKKIKLNRRKVTLKKGKSFKLKVTLTPKNSQDKIIFKTSNKKIVKVSKTGKIKALKKGKAKITVVSGKKKIVCKVTVK